MQKKYTNNLVRRYKRNLVKKKDINLRSSVQEMGGKSTIDKFTIRKCYAGRDEDVVKFQDLSQCAS